MKATADAEEFKILELRRAHAHLVLGLPAGFWAFGPTFDTAYALSSVQG